MRWRWMCCLGTGRVAAHRNERKLAGLVDRDVPRGAKPGVGADGVDEARRAAAGERGDRPGGGVDAANEVGAIVLRCSGGGVRWCTDWGGEPVRLFVCRPSGMDALVGAY